MERTLAVIGVGNMAKSIIAGITSSGLGVSKFYLFDKNEKTYSTLKDNEAFAEQIDVLRGVEQEVVTSAPVILPHGGEHVVDVEVLLLHLDVTLRQFPTVVVAHVLIESVERGDDAPVCPDALDVGTHGTAQFPAFGFRHLVVLRLPECQQ